MIQSVRFDFRENRVSYVDERGRINSFKDNSLRNSYEKVLGISGIEVLEDQPLAFDMAETEPEEALI